VPGASSQILDHADYRDEYLPLPLVDHGLVMKREEGSGPRGTVKTNVPHRVEMGSPDGFEFGYGGSGPSDLALNAVEHLIQHLASEGEIDAPSDYYTEEEGQVDKGRVSTLAFRLSHEFKSRFVASASDSGASYDFEELRDWLLGRLEEERE
jgi:hypothetical protein